MPKQVQLSRPLDEWGTSAAQFYAYVENKTIAIHLRSNQVLTGELVDVDTYDLVLLRENDKTLIPKHAIEWIELAGS